MLLILTNQNTEQILPVSTITITTVTVITGNTGICI